MSVSLDITTDSNIELDESINYEDIDSNISTSNKNTYNNYYSHVKKSQNYITKFEKAKIIGIRAQMIASGAVPCVDVPKGVTDALSISYIEYNEKKMPLLIRRKLTDNTIEDWRLEDFIN